MAGGRGCEPSADLWPWRSAGSGDVELLIIGDIQVQRRADPATAFAHVTDTLQRADLVYANLEGMLVPSKVRSNSRQMGHPGPDGVKALVAAGIDAVGVANNVVWDQQNLLETREIDAHGATWRGRTSQPTSRSSSSEGVRLLRSPLARR